MKVSMVTLHFKKGITTLGGFDNYTFTEGDSYSDLHYIVREGQHVVNYNDPSTGKRHGISLPASDVRQVNTIL